MSIEVLVIGLLVAFITVVALAIKVTVSKNSPPKKSEDKTETKIVLPEPISPDGKLYGSRDSKFGMPGIDN